MVSHQHLHCDQLEIGSWIIISGKQWSYDLRTWYQMNKNGCPGLTMFVVSWYYHLFKVLTQVCNQHWIMGIQILLSSWAILYYPTCMLACGLVYDMQDKLSCLYSSLVRMLLFRNVCRKCLFNLLSHQLELRCLFDKLIVSWFMQT